MKIKLNTIEDALNDFKNGKVLIVVDDENRENEGDFVFPAQIITKDIVNFMIKHYQLKFSGSLLQVKEVKRKINYFIGVMTF